MRRLFPMVIIPLLLVCLAAVPAWAASQLTDGWLTRSRLRVAAVLLKGGGQGRAFTWRTGQPRPAADDPVHVAIWDKGLREAFDRALGAGTGHFGKLDPEWVRGAASYATPGRPLSVTTGMAHLYRDKAHTVDLGAGAFMQYTEDARLETSEGLEYTDRVFWSRRSATQDLAVGLGICVNF